MLGVLVIIVYTFIEDPELIEFRYGILTTVLMLLLVASPFAQLVSEEIFLIHQICRADSLLLIVSGLQGEVIKTKSTETLPFPIILSGTVVCFLWFLHGVIIENPFVQVCIRHCLQKRIMCYLLITNIFIWCSSRTWLHSLCLQSSCLCLSFIRQSQLGYHLRRRSKSNAYVSPS